MHRTARWTTRSLILAACLAAPAPLLAEPTGTGNSDPLGGPTVKDRDVPGGRGQFGRGAGERGRPEHPGMRFAVFLGAVRSLNGPDAPDNVRPTDEQIGAVRTIAEEFRAKAEEFRAAHAEEIEQLQKEAGIEPGAFGPGARGPGGPPDENAKPRGKAREKLNERARAQGGEPKELTPEQQAAREKLRTLHEQGPNPEEYRAMIWKVLSPEQQQYVEARLSEMRERAANHAPRGKGTGGEAGKGKGKRGKEPPAQENADAEMSPE